ncbi:rhomboid family intramembrane serine protease [Piscinibacter sp. XHJ-5]|uniref:rhomboid family intramembrane serine protease n=1 Tax=Piscinibacter sp. XHJ-5 TaxID=3037797 RepID=UPI0024536A79|nr:rhomboid family intramembrane serine protease [Piscinibacter sp. XHJ-5]
MAEPSRVWAGLAALLCSGALIGWSVPREVIDWQPALAWLQPWRALSAVFVHYSLLHLGANLAGGVLVGALGHAARMPLRGALAWAAAWPLAQLGLVLQPQLLHYGGLSGVLHAGVAVVAVHLLTLRGRRLLGSVMLGVLLAKVLSETPWTGALRHPPGWDIAIAPLAHASGLASGVLCAVIAEGFARCPYHRRP